MHAHYGNQWLSKLLEVRGEETDPKIVRQRCHGLVDAIIADATDEEREEIVRLADNMIAKAEKLIASTS
jgi:CRP-like cAMP-binding protein